MAKPLQERLAGALESPRVTITDLRALIDETKAEREQHLGTAAAADRDSVDVMLADSVREAAADAASRSKRMAQGYASIIERLEAKLASKLESDRRKVMAAEQTAAIAERDKIAAQWRQVWPEVTAKLVRLFQDTLANDARLAAADLKGEASAEAVARGLPRNFSTRHAFVDRLTQMYIPSLEGERHHVRLWPPHAVSDPGLSKIQNEMLAELLGEPA